MPIESNLYGGGRGKIIVLEVFLVAVAAPLGVTVFVSGNNAGTQWNYWLQVTQFVCLQLFPSIYQMMAQNPLECKFAPWTMLSPSRNGHALALFAPDSDSTLFVLPLRPGPN